MFFDDVSKHVVFNDKYCDVIFSLKSAFYDNFQVKVTIEKDCNKLKDDIQNDLHNLQEQYRPKVKCDPEEVKHYIKGMPVKKIRTAE